MAQNEQDRVYMPVFLLGLFLIALNMYWFAYDIFVDLHLVSKVSDQLLAGLARANLFKSQYTLKAFVLLFLVFTYIVKAGKTINYPWSRLIILLVVSLAIYAFPYINSALYLCTTAVGFAMTSVSIAYIGRKLHGLRDPNNSPYETFEQGTKKPIVTDYSVNFRIKYMVGGKWKYGYLNVVNPFRGNMIFGLPGSGKSFSIILEYLWQMINKGFSCMCYDFKYPELSTYVYNCYLRSRDVFKKKYEVEPYFCVINMSDPTHSMRCNPLHKKYIPDMTAAIQKAKIIRKNRMDPTKDTGFFADNAENLWAAVIWVLRQIDDGKYCDLPHFIELMLAPQNQLLKLLEREEFGCAPLIRDILSADSKGANEQVQGILASATTPLKSLRTDSLYWAFSGNNVDLAINRRERPTILCIGNDPGSKDVFATGIALITSELYLQVNAPGRIPCALVQDEYPTMKPEGFDVIVATGRSNLLAPVAAAQDMDQLIRDLKKEDANAFLSIIGNQFFGQMTGSHKREISEMFGQHKVQQQSLTTGSQHDTINTSYHLEKRLPEDKLATLSQGTFAAIVTDGRGEEKLDNKLHCAEILVDPKSRPGKKDGKWEEIPAYGESYFNQKKIKRDVENDAERYCCEYLFLSLVKREEEKIEADRYATRLPDIVLREEALKNYKESSAHQKAELLKKTVKYYQEQEVKEKKLERMNEITGDIDVIFGKYEIKLPKQDAGNRPNPGTPLNGNEKPATGDPSKLNDNDTIHFNN